MRTNSKPAQSKPPQTSSKPASKPASKGPSQAQSKKVEVQKVIIKSDGNEIKDAFELFDANDGRINAREIRQAMQNIGFDEKNPGAYEVMTELDNPRNKNLGGATFNDFCQTVNNRIPERETTEDLRRVFNLFLDDPNATTTSLASIKKVADELGENIEELELGAMLNKASKAGDKLTFEDFVAIMTGAQN
jgi:Ca2+-binding EF-hand superfamily protein